VLRNHDTGFGVPVAFLLTKNTDNQILTRWLKALCKKMRVLFSNGQEDYNYKPQVVITDQGNAEILAIKTTFPGVPIHYCAWHVLKVWEREVKKRMTMTGLSQLPVPQRIAVRAQVKAFLAWHFITTIVFTNIDLGTDCFIVFNWKK
jgi:hypothetical protein